MTSMPEPSQLRWPSPSPVPGWSWWTQLLIKRVWQELEPSNAGKSCTSRWSALSNLMPTTGSLGILPTPTHSSTVHLPTTTLCGGRQPKPLNSMAIKSLSTTITKPPLPSNWLLTMPSQDPTPNTFILPTLPNHMLASVVTFSVTLNTSSDLALFSLNRGGTLAYKLTSTLSHFRRCSTNIQTGSSSSWSSHHTYTNHLCPASAMGLSKRK